MKTTKRKTRAVRLRTYEVILAGFDASTDRTDDLVKWVNAPHLAAVRAFIKRRALPLQMAPSALHGPMRLHDDGVDVTLDANGRVTKGCALGWTGQVTRVRLARPVDLPLQSSLRTATRALNADKTERDTLIGIISGLVDDIVQWHAYAKDDPAFITPLEFVRLKEARDMLNGVSPAPSFPTTLYVLIIDNDSGLTSSIHRTKAGATNALFTYVKDNWNTEHMGEIPAESTNAIDIYFKDDRVQDDGDRADISPCKIES